MSKQFVHLVIHLVVFSSRNSEPISSTASFFPFREGRHRCAAVLLADKSKRSAVEAIKRQKLAQQILDHSYHGTALCKHVLLRPQAIPFKDAVLRKATSLLEFSRNLILSCSSKLLGSYSLEDSRV